MALDRSDRKKSESVRCARAEGVLNRKHNLGGVETELAESRDDRRCLIAASSSATPKQKSTRGLRWRSANAKTAQKSLWLHGVDQIAGALAKGWRAAGVLTDISFSMEQAWFSIR